MEEKIYDAIKNALEEKNIELVFFKTLFPNILQFRSDGIYAGHVNVWSDWSLHIGMARIFATKDPSEWFAYHPMYADGKFTYGFLTNLISGLMMRKKERMHIRKQSVSVTAENWLKSLKRFIPENR